MSPFPDFGVTMFVDNLTLVVLWFFVLGVIISGASILAWLFDWE